MIAFMKEQAEKTKTTAGSVGEPGKSRSVFMDIYATGARAHMQRYGTTKEQFAKIAVKNHRNGSLNPHAQYREVYTLEEILASPPVTEPLTRLMHAQDTGGAIRGPVRADFFWGFGHDAGALAGRMKQEGKLWLLWPADLPLPQGK